MKSLKLSEMDKAQRAKLYGYFYPRFSTKSVLSNFSL